MTDKELATNLQAQALTEFYRDLYELKSILETYLDKLNEDEHPYPEEATKTVGLLVQTVKYKHEQLIKLDSEIEAYWRIVKNPLCTKGGKHAE